MHPCFTDGVKADRGRELLKALGGSVGRRAGAHDPLPAEVPMCVSGNRRDTGTCGSRASRSWAGHLRPIPSRCAGRSELSAGVRWGGRRLQPAAIPSPGPPAAKVLLCRLLCP